MTFLNYSLGRDMPDSKPPADKPYFVTAEYLDGYRIVGRFKTLAAAKKRLARLEVRLAKGTSPDVEGEP